MDKTEPLGKKLTCNQVLWEQWQTVKVYHGQKHVKLLTSGQLSGAVAVHLAVDLDL